MSALFLMALILLTALPLGAMEEWRRVFWLLDSPEDQAITPEEIGPSGCGLMGWAIGLAVVGVAILYVMVIVMGVDTL
jgi:hypothetical protein